MTITAARASIEAEVGQFIDYFAPERQCWAEGKAREKAWTLGLTRRDTALSPKWLLLPLNTPSQLEARRKILDPQHGAGFL